MVEHFQKPAIIDGAPRRALFVRVPTLHKVWVAGGTAGFFAEVQAMAFDLEIRSEKISTRITQKLDEYAATGEVMHLVEACHFAADGLGVLH